MRVRFFIFLSLSLCSAAESSISLVRRFSTKEPGTRHGEREALETSSYSSEFVEVSCEMHAALCVFANLLVKSEFKL